MTIRFDRSCSSSHAPARLAALASLALALTGCVLTGIEPDEIDFADGETGVTGDGSEGDGDGDGDAGGDGDATSTGDGDPSTGDGDGDPGTGDGDGDTGTGDGDGDPTTTGDGDGDGDVVLCADLQPAPVYDGSNPIVLAGDAGDVFTSSCGGPGPDGLFVYESTADGLVTFDLEQPDFDAIVYLVGPSCVPLDELACSDTGVEAQLTVGQLVYIVIDSAVADQGGAVTLTITGP